MTRFLQSGRGPWRARSIAAACSAVLGTGAVAGCGTITEPPPIEVPPDPVGVTPIGVTSNIDKVDLLLMLDNSRSMADKQLILAASVPDLVGSLVNPPCIDKSAVPAQPAMQPQSPLESCPAGMRRAIRPITDIHIGIVTSSLGGHGSDSCKPAETQSCSGSPNASNNDAGHLVARADACGGAGIPTYQNQGFLAWDPAQKLAPPGTKDLGSIAIDAGGVVSTLTPGLYPALKDLVMGVGQIGCGYESQLESWYRFLADPEPYQTLVIEDGKATPQGADELLLAERADFLRPSSLLAIVMLTDENDCSMKETGQFYHAAQQHKLDDPSQKLNLPRARQECATNPDDPCCKSCAQPANGCPVDPQCEASPLLTSAEDDLGLRCFDQKRRFGIDFLYPIDRYVSALRSPTLPNRQGDLVPNPIFNDLNRYDDDDVVRDPSLVMLTGIVGVPWQAIARTDPSGNPDLVSGLNQAGKSVGGFKNASELDVKDSTGHSPWDRILGDPLNHVPPLDPHMIESTTPRAGLPGPTAAAGTDPVNGHEYTIQGNDLEYACIFDLPTPRDCTALGAVGCDCADPANDNPLCDATTKTTQVRAKAYPGLRELAVLRSLGAQGAVASVCPTQLSNPGTLSYGYRPALAAVVERLSGTFEGQCLPRELEPDANGLVTCTLIEARSGADVCSCDGAKGRRAVSEANAPLVAAINATPQAMNAGFGCFCEVIQAGDPTGSSPEEHTACIGDPADVPVIQGGKDQGQSADGWCYVSPSQIAGASSEIVKSCPATEKRMMRLLGDSTPSSGSRLFLDCTVP